MTSDEILDELHRRIRRTCRCLLEERQIDYTRSAARRVAESQEKSPVARMIDTIIDETVAENSERETDFEFIENEVVRRFPEHYRRWLPRTLPEKEN